MKKITFLFFFINVVLFALTACKPAAIQPTSTPAAFDPSQVKTMGDILHYENEGDYQQAFSDTEFVFVFSADGSIYRAAAKLPKEVSNLVWSDDPDGDRDQKLKKALSELEVTSIENLSEQIPKQEELDKLIGKTGGELFDDGWTYWYYDLADMDAGLKHGAFSYNVKFDYDGEPMENRDDFDFYEAFKDLKVRSVTYEGLGDAANPE